ncbi:YopX-like protein [Listeria phage LP-048]|uniref:YopX-like protein n=1 Tax=Listeria phage LP-048 TaxID=1173764 RepID=A0A059T5Y3_9CAUD|nr:YopX-like protein [Listeria phage LP-048]AHL19688.1 YopX-like protein [Listeria phage LP-048]
MDRDKDNVLEFRDCRGSFRGRPRICRLCGGCHIS